MENDKLNNAQMNPTSTPPAQSGNQPFTANTQPTGIVGAPSMPGAAPFTPTPNSFPNSTKGPGKAKKIIIVIVALVVVAAAVVATLFLTGIIGGEHRVAVGDYTVAFDEGKWSSSIGQDGKTLILVNKESVFSGIGILPYSNEITYDLFGHEDNVKSFISQISDYQFVSQSEQTISGTRCVVVNIKYKKATSGTNNKAIKAFCEGKDSTVFLLEIEGANQSELDSNLSTGVDIINTAKHK